jgi:hypothetical protein
MITAMLATGNIRNYQITVGGLQLLNLPVSYIFLKLGAMPEVTVMVAIAISQVCLFVRLSMLGKATGFSVKGYIIEVYIPMLFKVVLPSIWLPIILLTFPIHGYYGLIINASACLLCTSVAIYVFGMKSDEREWLKDLIHKKMKGNDKNNR